MSIIWREEYSVGVKEIDLQHQHFIELMNKAYTAVYNNATKEDILKFVDELLTHGYNHFQTEEKYFDKFKYPLAEEHKKIHASLLEQAGAFKITINNALDYGKEVSKLVDFLEDWLVDHMLTEDMKYSPFFIQHGLS